MLASVLNRLSTMFYFRVGGGERKTKGKSFTCQVTHTPARRPNYTTVAATSLSISHRGRPSSQQQPEEIPHNTLPTLQLLLDFTPDDFFFIFSKMKLFSRVCNKSTRRNTLGNCCLSCFQQHIGHVLFTPPARKTIFLSLFRWRIRWSRNQEKRKCFPFFLALHGG